MKLMSTASKTRKHLWQRVRAMKVMWSLFAYQHLKLTRGHCKAADVMCLFCGGELDTQAHAHKCNHTAVADIRHKLFTDIAALFVGTFLDHVKDEKLKAWLMA